MKKTMLGLLPIIVLMFTSVSAYSAGQADTGVPGSDYPKRPIEIIVPFGAGGSSDLMSRQVANIMKNYVDIPVKVINKPGAGGIDGMVYVKNAPNDGYTILQITPSHAIATAVGRPNADLIGDFEPIANFQVDIVCFGVAKDSPIQNLEDMLDYAKANPGKLKIGGTSPGGLDDFIINGFSREAGIEMLYIPYKSSAQTKAAVLGGEIDIYQDKLISFLSMVKSGDIRPLVILNETRIIGFSELEDVPSSVEKGINFTQGSWRGYAVRKGTPSEVRDFLSDIIKKVYLSEEYLTASEKSMSNIIPGFIDQQQYGKMWVSEIGRFREILVK